MFGKGVVNMDKWLIYIDKESSQKIKSRLTQKLRDVAVRWRHQRMPGKQCQNYETKPKISVIWLQNFDPAL